MNNGFNWTVSRLGVERTGIGATQLEQHFSWP